MSFKNTFVLIFIFFIYGTLYAQYTPFFQNYALTEYNAGNKNWGVSLAENGKLYVANDNGLVEFDGMKWNFYQLPNKTVIRSVLAYKDKIYTGSYKEFGYWQKNTKGKLVYTSIGDFKDKEESKDEEFWQIFSYNDAIFFRSFSNLYVYSEGKVTRIKVKSGSTILSCNVIEGKAYISTVKNGVLILEGQDLIPFITDDKLYDVKIVSVAKYNNKLLIATALNGCYLFDGTHLESWDSEISSIIKEQQLNDFLVLQNKNMVFGTIKNGIYITNNSGDIIYHINKENGLLNNTVLSQELGENNKLWVGLDNGIALIDFNYSHVLYNDSSGKLGAVYDIINYKEVLYIGSNTGLFYLDTEKDNTLEFIEGSQGQVWNLKEINGQLFCGHNNGTYLVENKVFKEKVSAFTGGWVIKKVPELSNTFVQGTYGGLVRYDLTDDHWEVKHLGDETIPVKYMTFEDEHTLWVAHAYRGLFRVTFDKDYENITFKDYKNKGLWSDFNVKVHKIKNDICFKTNKGWQKYEALIDSIVPHNLLNDVFGVNTDIISESDSDVMVTKNAKDKISFVSKIEGEQDIKFPNDLIQKRLVVNAESVSQLSDSTYTLNLYDGFMLIGKSLHNSADVLLKPDIETIEIDKQLIDLENSLEYELPYNKNISISISSPKSNNHFFEYAVSNSDSLNWYRMENEKLELSSLSSGDHQVHFRTANILGNLSPAKMIQIHVLPPWYQNSMFYLLVALLGSLIIYWLHKRKIKKEHQALHNKLVREQEVLLKEKAIENDKKIVQLKNESLKNEVKLKSKQLANTAMALVKKNESMLDIKGELMKHKNSFENPLMYKRLLRKIDNSIGHEDEWEIFEYNFNQVHEEFFNQLKSKHSQLTHKDLKICAYIKMNLLTKEIAPLMNVSIRGLETHRYRLKRKLNLGNDRSLGDYLRNFE